MNHHGNINMSWDDDIFTLKIKGAFNEVSLQYYGPLLMESVLNREVKLWKRLEIWDDEVLGSPTTIAVGKNIYEWYNNNGCVLTAFVICNALQEKIINDHFQSSAKIFFHIDEAKAWLNSSV